MGQTSREHDFLSLTRNPTAYLEKSDCLYLKGQTLKTPLEIIYCFLPLSSLVPCSSALLKLPAPSNKRSPQLTVFFEPPCLVEPSEAALWKYWCYKTVNPGGCDGLGVQYGMPETKNAHSILMGDHWKTVTCNTDTEMGGKKTVLREAGREDGPH
jgi:hypothetical protein